MKVGFLLITKVELPDLMQNAQSVEAGFSVAILYVEEY
jgi:hypothetical protein